MEEIILNCALGLLCSLIIVFSIISVILDVYASKVGMAVPDQNQESLMDSVNRANRLLAVFPRRMLRIFRKLEWEVVVVQNVKTDPDTPAWYEEKIHPELFTDGKLKEGDYFIAGSINSSKKRILVLSGYEESIFHEMGHWIDYIGLACEKTGTRPSESEPFVECWKREAPTFCQTFGEYNTLSPTEFFAESVEYYYLDAGRFRKCCPEYYELLRKFLERYGWSKRSFIKWLLLV